MSEDAIKREFSGNISVLEVAMPDNSAPIGLVKLANGAFCVVELDDEGCAPILEDFTPDEAEIARAHFDERVASVTKRKPQRTHEMIDDIIGNLTGSRAAMPAFID